MTKQKISQIKFERRGKSRERLALHKFPVNPCQRRWEKINREILNVTSSFLVQLHPIIIHSFYSYPPTLLELVILFEAYRKFFPSPLRFYCDKNTDENGLILLLLKAVLPYKKFRVTCLVMGSICCVAATCRGGVTLGTCSATLTEKDWGICAAGRNAMKIAREVAEGSVKVWLNLETLLWKQCFF